jgi:transposase
MTIAVLGIDLGKTLCSVVGLDRKGAVVLRRRLRRSSLPKFVEKQPSCIIGMEACCGAHHLGRQFREMQHDVRLMPPEYVKPYVKSHKNDDLDAEAIAEAASRPTMRFVAIKSEEQLDIQTLHRARARLVGERTALINQLRGVLFDRGIVIAKGRPKLDRWLRDEFASAVGLSDRMQGLVNDMVDELHALDARVKQLDREFKELSEADESARLLRTVPGIGALNATALAAAVGDASAFSKGRDFAAWLGLVPRQITTGGRPRLVGISKRGSTYMRVLLIHGARAALPWLAKRETALGAWLRAILARAKRNVVVVALANKLARIAWAVLSKRQAYAAMPVLPA